MRTPTPARLAKPDRSYCGRARPHVARSAERLRAWWEEIGAVPRGEWFMVSDGELGI